MLLAMRTAGSGGLCSRLARHLMAGQQKYGQAPRGG
jgi:hypothetical protein